VVLEFIEAELGFEGEVVEEDKRAEEGPEDVGVGGAVAAPR
jgi:hypothetical protein